MADSDWPQASDFFLDHLDRLREAGRLGAIVDLACGRGRQAIAGVRAGLPVIGLDVSPTFLATLKERADALGEEIPCVRADLESAYPLPLAPGSAGAVIVFRFLFRPLLPALVELLAPGGLLLYETFRLGQRDLPYGPSNPDYLLRDGELPTLFPELEIELHQELAAGSPRPDCVARLAARKPVA